MSQPPKSRLAAIAGERAKLQKTFTTEFPNYTALSNPLPLTVKEIQADDASTRSERFDLALADELYDIARRLGCSNGRRCRCCHRLQV